MLAVPFVTSIGAHGHFCVVVVETVAKIALEPTICYVPFE